MEMLFERFISRERGEPPDIDVDFEHQRREEVIQYIYAKYGRERAALAAEVISYRPKSAVRDVGKALGMDLDQVDRLARNLNWWDGHAVAPERLREVGLDPYNPLVLKTMRLVHEILGFPRHLSQHVGGFVISRGELSRLVPVENAAMEGRTVIQWDKDDLDTLGLLKVDCLALGMLSAIRRALDLINGFRGSRLAVADIPPEDPAVYRMIQRGETTGVFQIESRAQMAMLPRLRPACFYDLVIEVAIVRPGPIQGDMVHPYLRRRQGLEPVELPVRGGQGGPGPDPGGTDLPGAGDQVRPGGGRIQPGRGGSGAPVHGRLASSGRARGAARAAHRRHAGAGLRARAGRAHLLPDPGLRRIRLPRVPCGELRAARLRLRLAQAPRAGRLLCGADQQPAHGLLWPGPADPGGATAGGGGAAGGCGGERVGLHPGAGWWPLGR